MNNFEIFGGFLFAYAVGFVVGMFVGHYWRRDQDTNDIDEHSNWWESS